MLAMKRLISDRRYITNGWQGHPVLGHLNNNITGEISQVPSALDWELIWSTVTAAKTVGVPGAMIRQSESKRVPLPSGLSLVFGTGIVSLPDPVLFYCGVMFVVPAR